MDDVRRFRMTCPVSTLCPWRGPTVDDAHEHAQGVGDDSLDYHLQLQHPEVPPSTLWETWERVWPEPYSARQRVVIAAAWIVAICALGLLMKRVWG